jgi:excisionase family DNA binding protein
MAPQYITVVDIMSRLKVSRSTAYELMARLGAIKIGRSVRLMQAKLDSYLRELERSRVWTQAQPAIEDAEVVPAPGEHAELSANRLRLAEVAARSRRARPATKPEPRPDRSPAQLRWDKVVADSRKRLKKGSSRSRD